MKLDTENLLKSNNILKYFDKVLSVDDVKSYKPDLMVSNLKFIRIYIL